MKRRGVALLGAWSWVVGLSWVLACQARDPSPAARGARAFQRTCASCHGADGRGALRVGLLVPPRDLTNPEFQAQMTNEQLRHSIRVGKGQMPSFGGLMAEDEIAELIAFIRTLVPPGSLPPGLLAPASSAPGAVAEPSAAATASPPTARGALGQ